MSGAIIGLSLSVIVTTAIMLVANIFITPIYAAYVGFPIDIYKELPRLILPFNLTKAVMNASLVLLLYKPLTNALRASKLITGSEAVKSSSKKTTILTLVAAVALLIAAIIVYLVVFKADFKFFK